MFRRNKGQSSLEYALVLVAIIAAILIAANKFVKPRVESSMDHVSGEMDKQVGRIQFGSGSTTTGTSSTTP